MDTIKLRIYGFLVSKRQFLITEAILLGIFIAAIIVTYFMYGRQPDPEMVRKTRWSIYLFILMIFWVIVESQFHLNRYTKAQLKIINRQREKLEQQQLEILDSIHYASRIQNATLPSEKIIRNYLPESFVLYIPKDIVAGDFYWIANENDRIYFTAADCTGHGVPGAIISVLCSNALTKCVKELKIGSPAEILDHTVDILESNFAQSEEEIKDGMDLALCCLNREKGSLEFAGAYNPLYRIRNHSLEEFKPDKQPVGRRQDRDKFTNHLLDLVEGDSYYIFSDGFADQFGGPKGKKFKYGPFRELLLSIHSEPMNTQKSILERELQNWKGDHEQVDDICILGFRV